MKKIKAIGIDYSLNSPAVCIASGDLSFKNCKFYYISSKKKYIGKFDNITGTEYPEWSDPIERFSKISQWVHTSLKSYGDMELFGGKTVVHLEGYSYGSKGQAIFQIAENCGILKYKLQERNIPYDIIVPSVVKKGATGKGNADKDMMYEAFNKETKIDLKKLFDTDKVGNPISDIADSYFIQKVGNENSNSN